MGPVNSVSDAEREVLKVLWKLERATVREIREHLESRGTSWAHTTISTLLARMEQKRLVARDSTGFAHVYSAVASRTSLVQQRLVDLADEFCDGEQVPLMLALVENQKFTAEEVQQFRALVDRLQEQSSGGKRRPKNKKRS